MISESQRSPVAPPSRRPWASVVLAALLWSGIASATVHRALTIEDLSRDADMILRGQVAQVESRLVDDGRRIATSVRVVVTAIYKGDSRDEVEILLTGGTHGDLVQMVRGMPELEVDDEVLLFLSRRPAPEDVRPRFFLTGMGLGAFHIENDLASRRVRGLKVVTGPLDRPRPLSDEERIIDLSLLEQRIRAAISEPGR